MTLAIEVWVGICLLGGLLYLLQKIEFKLLSNKYLSAVSLILIPFLIRHAESKLTYILDGIAVFIFIVFCFNFKFIQKALSIKPLVRCGDYSFQIYLIHTILNKLVIYPLCIFLKEYINHYLLFFLGLSFSIILSIVASFLIKKVADLLLRKTNGLFNLN